MRQRLSALGFLMLLLTSLKAVQTPVLDVKALSEGSDIIVAGRVSGVESAGKTQLEVGGNLVPAIRMAAFVDVDLVLKGTADRRQLRAYFALPAFSKGQRGVAAGDYVLIFLKRRNGQLEIAHPSYGTLPAVPGTPAGDGSLSERVLGQVVAVYLSSDADQQKRIRAVYALTGVQSPIIVRSLVQLLHTPGTPEHLQLTVAAALLQRNEPAALPVARDALLQKPGTVPSFALNNLAYALGTQMRDPSALPILGQLLAESSDVITRRNAASGLRNVATLEAVPLLSAALSDTDFEVRYFAVIGLAEICDLPEKRPLLEEFRENEDFFVQFWKSKTTAAGGQNRGEPR